MKLSYHDQSDRLQFMTKTRQDNDVIDCKDAVYVKNNTKLLCVIRSGVVYDKNQTK